jgi:hypothetical protein
MVRFAHEMQRSQRTRRMHKEHNASLYSLWPLWILCVLRVPVFLNQLRELRNSHLRILIAAMLPSILKKALGLLPQEYVCVAAEDIPDHPSVFMTFKGSDAALDVTAQHILLGYKPVIIAIISSDIEIVEGHAQTICLTFTQSKFKADTRWRGFSTSARALARMELSLINVEIDEPGIAFYKGEFGEHSFLPAIQSIANRLSDLNRRKQASEANLDGNLYEQVRIAYSVPRIISVITVKDNDLLNFFPTDLHGGVDSEYYLSSLRIGGMACSQVDRLRRIVIANVDVDAFRKTYELGKNHMSPMQPVTHFEPSFVLSASGIPVYPHATTYIELEWVRQWDVGIHRIFLYRAFSMGEVKSGKTLAHIHRYYAQWRINHRLSAEYFFR